MFPSNNKIHQETTKSEKETLLLNHNNYNKSSYDSTTTKDKEDGSDILLLNAVSRSVVPLSSSGGGGGGSLKKQMMSVSNNSRLSLSVRSCVKIPDDVTHLVPSQNVAKSFGMLGTMVIMAIVVLLGLGELYGLGRGVSHPNKEPIGPYVLISKQDGEEFFDHYDFYEGLDSAGSNGFQTYVSREKAEAEGIVRVITEHDEFATDYHNNHNSSDVSSTSSSSSIWGLGVPTPENESVSDFLF